MEKRKKPKDSDEFLIALGAVLKRIREEKAKAQIDVAVAIGRQRTYVSELEAGKHNPTLSTLRLICGFYEVELSEVIAKVELNLA